MTLTYAYLVSWILGGLVLLTIVLMKSQLRPTWLGLGLMAFGATGFLLLGFGAVRLPQVPMYAGGAGLLGALLGLGVERLGARRERTVPPGP